MFKEFVEFPFPDKWWFVLLLVWVVVWKAMALWKAARLGQKWWYVALLLLNTFGIFEIFYIYVFSKKQAEAHRARRADDVVKEDHHAHTTGASFLDNVDPIDDPVEKVEPKPVVPAPAEPKPEEKKPSEPGHLA